ncbi:MAG: hypothetical protein WA484_08880 [Solirubrobacteraceae bacterium]
MPYTHNLSQVAREETQHTGARGAYLSALRSLFARVSSPPTIPAALPHRLAYAPAPEYRFTLPATPTTMA